MKKLNYSLVVLFLFLFINSSYAADVMGEFKEYLNNKAQEVKKTDNPVEKREILDKMFHKILSAADNIEALPVLSDKERAGIDGLKKKVIEKSNELNGLNGFTKVADSDLNRFADYSVQEVEQAAEYITISVLALVLIIILVAILL